MADSTEKGSFFQRLTTEHLPVLFLIGLSCFIAFARYHTYDEPLEHDITTAMVIANEMRHGRPYYSDLWENKPPAQYVAYIGAQYLFGYGRESLYVLNVFMTIVVLLGVYAAASSAGGGRVAGLWAALFWALISGDMDLQANQPNTEAFMNPPLIWVFALFLRARKSRPYFTPWQLVAIGGLLSLATFYKPHAVFYGLFLCIAHVVFVPERTAAARKRAILEALVIAGIGGLAWAAFFGYFAYTGRFQMVYTTMFVYSRHYSGNMFWNLARSLGSHLFPSQLHTASALVFLTVIGGIIAWIKKISRPWALLLGYALATQITIGLPGRFYTHYYQLWLPLLTVGAGWSIVLLAHVLKEEYRSWLPHAFAIIAVVFMMQMEIWAYRMDPEEWSRRAYGGVYAASERLADEVGKILEPEETLYVLGDEPGFYFKTKKRPAVGVFFLQDAVTGPLAKELTNRVLTDLNAKPPDLVIILNSALDMKTEDSPAGPLKPNHPIRMWVTQNYCPAIVNPKEFFTICARPGSALEQRDSYRLLRAELSQ
jgi:uncharacterized membrane protein (UPF0136 family)